MFLNAYAIAAVEHWRKQVGDQLRRAFATQTVLPHYSPGYDGWDLKDQARLFRLLLDRDKLTNGGGGPANPIQLLESGGLLPHKSTLAVYGVTPRDDIAANEIDEYWSCRVGPGIDSHAANYVFPEKTLKKWRDQRSDSESQDRENH